MPEKIIKSGRCYKVKNTRTGQVHAKCTTKTKAKRQVRLLEGIKYGTLKPRKRSKR